MLRNDNSILKNGEKIFKSQVLDSYLSQSSCFNVQIEMTTTGLSASDPLYAYFETPTAVLKTCYTTDLTNQNITFATTGNACVKNVYFCGNLQSVDCVGLCNSSLDAMWTGDFIGSINQFPNVQGVDYSHREVDFNNDISNTSVPRTLETLRIYDRGIQGNLNTVENIENVKNWYLYYAQFTGTFHDIDFKDTLTDVCFRYNPSALVADINTLINNNNSTLSTICMYQAQGVTMCADTLDISTVTDFDVYAPYTNVKGTFVSSPVFNTGLTRFQLTSCCVSGDLTNWDFSDTELYAFCLYNQYGNYGDYCGSLSGWTLPATLQNFSLNYAYNVTDVPSDWCGNTPDFRYLSLQNLPALSGNVETWSFPSTLYQIQLYQTELSGNIENFDFPSCLVTYQLRFNNFTGNLANIVPPTGTTQFYLEGNCLTGNVACLSIYPNTNYINLNCNPDVYLDLSVPMDTCNVYSLNVANTSGVTGSFNNLTLDNLQYLCMNYTPIESDLNELDISNLRHLYVNFSSLSQDVTPLFSANTSNLCTLCLGYNSNLSGDTTNWQLDSTCRLSMEYTALTGRFCHACPYCLSATNTAISSCIDTDLDFSVRGYNISLDNTCLQGCLSGTSLYYPNVYSFAIGNNPNLYGANDFTNELFANRGNFARSYVTLSYYSLGDFVTGATESLGDLGTYAGDPSGMDLTEAQVNNLVAGIDYDGGGSNTPWTPRNKIWWMKNACVSSISTTRRYSQFGFNYSWT